jgi:hypothetical protein
LDSSLNLLSFEWIRVYNKIITATTDIYSPGHQKGSK